MLVSDTDYAGALRVENDSAVSGGTFGNIPYLGDGGAPVDAAGPLPGPDLPRRPTCSSTSYGQITADGQSGVALEITCNGTLVRITLVDVRSLVQGDVRPSAVAYVAGACHFTAARGAALTITHATGGERPAPEFVSSDFVRDLRLDVDLAAGDLVAEANQAASCAPPTRLALHGPFRFQASDFRQANRSGTCDHPGPNLPDVGKPLP